MVWDPARIVPRPWEDVVELYRQLAERNDDFRPLLRLVKHVASQPYARSIFAATSGTALLVARRAAVDWAADALRIDVDLSGAIRFARPEKQLVKPTTFECEAEKMVEALERYLGV
jgi:hypothetical protein